MRKISLFLRAQIGPWQGDIALANPAPDRYTARMGTLYYGDNLDILTRTIADESVDLVYLDPPFNSAQNYNAFFEEKDGTAEEAEGNREVAGRASSRRADCPAFARGCLRFAPAQAFEDTWEWNHESRTAYDALSLRADKLGSVMRA